MKARSAIAVSTLALVVVLAGCRVEPRSYVNLETHLEHCRRAARECGERPSAWCNTAGDCADRPLAARERNPSRALAFYLRGCGGGDGQACVSAASVRLAGEDAARDLDAGLACIERACDVYAGFCEFAARSFEGRWIALPVDLERARGLRDLKRTREQREKSTSACLAVPPPATMP